MKDNLKFLSTLFLLRAVLTDKPLLPLSSIQFPGDPLELDGRRYTSVDLNVLDQELILRDGNDALTVTGEEDWPADRWDALREGLYDKVRGAVHDNAYDILLRCMDMAFRTGKKVEAARPVWVLVCTNNEGEVVSAERFISSEAARKAMLADMKAEADDLRLSGWDDDDISEDADARNARLLKDGEVIYTWHVSKV